MSNEENKLRKPRRKRSKITDLCYNDQKLERQSASNPRNRKQTQGQRPVLLVRAVKTFSDSPILQSNQRFSALVTAIERIPVTPLASRQGGMVEWNLLSKIHGTALVSNIQGRARLEESKDSDSPFGRIWDNGQSSASSGRAVRFANANRSHNQGGERPNSGNQACHKDWGSGNQADDIGVLRSTAPPALSYAERYDWAPINVGRSSDGPIVLFRRGDLGEYLVNLNTSDRYWAQYAFQFSHEIGHILCGFREGDQSNHWFEEMLCETASLFALRKLSEEWKTNPPYPNWKSFADAFDEYAQERMDRQPWPKGLSLADWYAKEKDLLSKDAKMRDRNLMAAVRILPLFEKNPDGWAACFFLNKKKDKEKRSFETYLRDWSESCQTNEHRDFVGKIAKDFGFDTESLETQVAQTIQAVPMGAKFRELKDIFRLLETYHEAVETLGLTTTFANKEKWEMLKSDNRAERAIHWGAAAAPWRILSGRVAGIPSELMAGKIENRNEAAQILRDLHKQNYAKTIDEEMTRRVEDLDRAPHSVAEEVESVQADLRRVITLLSPAVKKARERLNQLAPSLPELARQLAKKARQAKARSETIAGKPEDQPVKVRQETAELQREQRLLGNEITLFNAAPQEANVQNALDKEGREIARDADDAAALCKTGKTQPPTQLPKPFRQATGFAERKPSKGIRKARPIGRGARSHCRSFRAGAGGEEVAESREDLRQVEKDLGIKEQVDEQFDQAERLAELAKLSAEELLEELEKELTENKPMQQELSEIAEDTVEEARQALEEATEEEEENIAEQLENADKEVVDEKKKLAKELDKLAQEIKKLADREVRQASNLARQANAGESFEELTESREELLDIAEEAKDGAKPEDAVVELAQNAQDLVEPLLQEASDLAEAAQSADEVSKLNPETAKAQAEQTDAAAQEARQLAQQTEEMARVAEAKAEQAARKPNKPPKRLSNRPRKRPLPNNKPNRPNSELRKNPITKLLKTMPWKQASKPWRPSRKQRKQSRLRTKRDNRPMSFQNSPKKQVNWLNNLKSKRKKLSKTQLSHKPERKEIRRNWHLPQEMPSEHGKRLKKLRKRPLY